MTENKPCDRFQLRSENLKLQIENLKISYLIGSKLKALLPKRLILVFSGGAKATVVRKLYSPEIAASSRKYLSLVSILLSISFLLSFYLIIINAVKIRIIPSSSTNYY